MSDMIRFECNVPRLTKELFYEWRHDIGEFMLEAQELLVWVWRMNEDGKLVLEVSISRHDSAMREAIEDEVESWIHPACVNCDKRTDITWDDVDPDLDFLCEDCNDE